jgi:hypothetical protein
MARVCDSVFVFGGRGRTNELCRDLRARCLRSSIANIVWATYDSMCWYLDPYWQPPAPGAAFEVSPPYDRLAELFFIQSFVQLATALRVKVIGFESASLQQFTFLGASVLSLTGTPRGNEPNIRLKKHLPVLFPNLVNVLYMKSLPEDGFGIPSGVRAQLTNSGQLRQAQCLDWARHLLVTSRDSRRWSALRPPLA